MTNSLCVFDLKNFNVERCILELIYVALKKKASSIAIRFNPKKHKIQVVDNGIGFTKNELSFFFNKKTINNRNKKTIFNKIKFNSNAVIITSRSIYSTHTYVTVASGSKITRVFQGYDRPSKGTTVTICEFNASKWDRQIDKNCSISFIIAAIAFIQLQVSFSLRNDEQNKMILNITKFHNSWEVLKYLKRNLSHEIPYFSTNQVLRGNKKTYDIIKIKSNKSKNNPNFSNMSVHSNQLLNNRTNGIIKNSILYSISKWKNWSCKIKSLNENENNTNINQSCFSNVNQIHISDQNFINLSQLSIWSDWSYHHTNLNNNYNNKKDIRDPHYKFLPISIYKILPFKHRKILNEQNYLQSSQCSSFNFNNTESNYIINETTKSFQNVNVRVCNAKRKFDEYKISRNTIHSIQVLKQINKEFIAAITNEKGKKVLIIIDQHAVHERIRYEGLIESYRKKNSYDYLSVKLNKELHISDISEKLLELIILHKEVFNRVGINVKSVIDSTTCLIDAVPECFIKKVKSYNKENNFYRLMKNVRQLLLEIANGLAISTNILPPILPITIHNVIASEACHEAIKFGDPLNVEECLLLIQALQDTKAPIRCAHGRPSIIPLIDLADIEKRKSSENVDIILYLFKSIHILFNN